MTSVTELPDTDIVFDLPNPHVWSPDSPKLYTSIVEVYHGDQLSDRRETRFGMRSVERRGTQILLNGEPIDPLTMVRQPTRGDLRRPYRSPSSTR